MAVQELDRTHALIAPGQGSQKIGMGRELTLKSPAAAKVWQETDEALRSSLGFTFSELVWNGTLEDLTRTENAQPAIIIKSLANRAALVESGLYGDDAYWHTGNSLGLVVALVTSGALDTTGAVQLGEARGRAFKYAVDKGPKTTMMAIQHDKPETVLQVVNDLRAEYPLSICLLNSDNQVVLGGREEDIQKARDYVTQQDAKLGRLLRILTVDAAFHSTFMEPAVEIYGEKVDKIDIQTPSGGVLLAGSMVEDGAEGTVLVRHLLTVADIKQALVRQLTHTERWRDVMRYLWNQGVTTMTELNEASTLVDMNRRMFGGDREAVYLPGAKDSKGENITIAWRWNAPSATVEVAVAQEAQTMELEETNEESKALLKQYTSLVETDDETVMEQFLKIPAPKTFAGMLFWYRFWASARWSVELSKIKPDDDFTKAPHINGDSLDYEVLRADVEGVFQNPVDENEAKDRTTARKMALATWEKKQKLMSA